MLSSFKLILTFRSIISSNCSITRALRSSALDERAPRISVSTEISAAKDTPPTKSPAATHDEHKIDWNEEMRIIRQQESRSVLLPPSTTEDEHVLASASSAPIQPSHNLAAYINKSSTLQQLIKLGVDLHRIERRRGLAQFVLRLDFDRDMRQHLQFLTDTGVAADQLGPFITKNPLIFKESIDDLQTRIHYLQSKRFQAADILRIVQQNPFWLMFPTQRIDARLGYFQKSFDLVGNECRQLTVTQPKLITYNFSAIRASSFTIREEFGFDTDETKQMLLGAPKIWMMSK